MTVAQMETLLPMSSSLKQQMAWAMALWPHSQARWLPGYCGRPAVTWPALPLCMVAEPCLGSRLRPASNAAYCCELGNFSLGRERSASPYPAEPALWRLPLTAEGPLEYPPLSLWGQACPLLAWHNCVPPCPSQS